MSLISQKTTRQLVLNLNFSFLSILRVFGSLVVTVDTEDVYIEFINAVDQEISLLERLRYRLIVLKALTAYSDGHGVLPFAIKETQQSYGDLRAAELMRATVTIKLTDRLNLDPGVGMTEIAAQSSGVWEEIVLEKRKAMIEAMNRVQKEINELSAALSRHIAETGQALEFIKQHSGFGYGEGGAKTGLLITGAI